MFTCFRPGPKEGVEAAGEERERSGFQLDLVLEVALRPRPFPPPPLSGDCSNTEDVHLTRESMLSALPIPLPSKGPWGSRKTSSLTADLHYTTRLVSSMQIDQMSQQQKWPLEQTQVTYSPTDQPPGPSVAPPPPCACRTLTQSIYSDMQASGKAVRLTGFREKE